MLSAPARLTVMLSLATLLAGGIAAVNGRLDLFEEAGPFETVQALVLLVAMVVALLAVRPLGPEAPWAYGLAWICLAGALRELDTERMPWLPQALAAATSGRGRTITLALALLPWLLLILRQRRRHGPTLGPWLGSGAGRLLVWGLAMIVLSQSTDGYLQTPAGQWTEEQLESLGFLLLLQLALHMALRSWEPAGSRGRDRHGGTEVPDS
jgi:hypothetical protein